MKQVVAIVQARMGSARLPGKMMAELGGKPVLEWVLRRVSLAQWLDDVVLATTGREEDDVLVRVAECLGVVAYRGSVDDVLDRFCGAAKATQAGVIVRICGDNPLVAPEEVDRVVREYVEHRPDYAFNHIGSLGNNYPNGLGAEVLDRHLLERLNRLVTMQRHREHVTSYLWDHATSFSIRAIPCPPELAVFPCSQVRLDIDTVSDLKRMRVLCRNLDVMASASEILKKWESELLEEASY